ncbi:MAG: glucose-6-phosphate isomerase [Thermodesulfobacteriota bacterium]
MEESGFRLNRPGRGEPTVKRYEDPKWVQSMRLSLDHNYAMAECLGESGLKYSDLEGLVPRLEALHQDLTAQRQSGQAGFMELPYDSQIVQDIRRLSKPLLEWCWDVVVLGVGVSASGVRALHQALRPPQHNKFPMARRHHKLGLWVADDIDPDHLWGLLDGLDLRRTAFNAISKSGDPVETLALFLWAYQLMKTRLGEDKVRELFVITTDLKKGVLRSLAAREHLPSLAVPSNVPESFSVLSAAGLFPAVLTGIEVEELLAGARAMDQRLKEAPVDRNPAYRLAALFYLFATFKERPFLIFMPYATTLAGMAEWVCQLWAESLGQRHDLQGKGVPVIRALGATDRQSQLHQFMEGPADKLITFLTVDKFQHHLEIPESYPEEAELSFLEGHSLQELLKVEHQATAFNLMKAGRPNLTLRLPEINPFTIGQLIYLLETATVAAAYLFGVNAFDRPGVERSEQTAYGLLGKPEFESFHRQFDAAWPALDKYQIS